MLTTMNAYWQLCASGIVHFMSKVMLSDGSDLTTILWALCLLLLTGNESKK